MTLSEVKAYISTHDVYESVRYFLNRVSIPAIPVADEYERYKALVRIDHPRSQKILIGGSGNWGFSFNPNKMFIPFHDQSDIDLVVVSTRDFVQAWDELRNFHRKSWYRIGFENQRALRRSGENVYSGFVSLKWIIDPTYPARIDYEEKVNSYSTKAVKYRKVNLTYFRNEIELEDYFIRSFKAVKGA